MNEAGQGSTGRDAVFPSVILSTEEIAALTGFRQPAKQLKELHKHGFWRARRLPTGAIILERAHYEAVCRGHLGSPNSAEEARQREADAADVEAELALQRWAEKRRLRLEQLAADRARKAAELAAESARKAEQRARKASQKAQGSGPRPPSASSRSG
ncbi:DUF4224 domain-containing protein [Rubrivivax benzoatilyticus]|uniref:DUF4224 domain-containing protein n=1 Tax=Rubrivivax benzoatilyticus TaxID=316997 RepID=UPI00020A3F90|nr:DUF4224 domain-containing protein [Rubrivivax benzoatilyticus]EGJ11965.1 hypothetical protein RBXJA2T_16622 [Rubrivivax benzoatilyticus JA2 = ATCC BAA-35]